MSNVIETSDIILLSYFYKFLCFHCELAFPNQKKIKSSMLSFLFYLQLYIL